MKYRAEIDGLRAVAIIPVVLFHAGFDIFSGGFVGVDVFFVISGYLITTIILMEMEQGSFSVLHFYERRARRILPALFLVMMVSLPFAWWWLLPSDMLDFSQSLIAVATSSSNILFWHESGYWGGVNELKPMLHTWSLAVEEQYYVIFPLFLMLMWRFRKRWILATFLGFAAMSLGISQWAAYHFPVLNFFMLPTRGWELAIGASIAFYFLYRKRVMRSMLSHAAVDEAMGFIGLFMIVYAVLAFDSQLPFPGLYALIPTMGTALIILFASPQTMVGRILGTRIMVFVGLISYSAYLWHQPMLAFARHRSLTAPSQGLLGALVVVSFLFAYLSWRYVENPFRKRGGISRKNIFVMAILGSLVFIGIGLTGHLTGGFSHRMAENGQYLQSIEDKLVGNKGLGEACDGSFASQQCKTAEYPEIAVWGDSFAMALIPGIMASNPDVKMIQMTKSVCGPFFNLAPIERNYPEAWARECLAFSGQVRQWLKGHHSVRYVVLSSPFNQYLSQGRVLLTRKGDVVKATHDLVLNEFKKTLDELKSMGISPIVISPPPENSSNIGRCLAKTEMFGGDLDTCNFRIDKLSLKSVNAYRFLREIEVQYRVLFLNRLMCDHSVCKTHIGASYIYRDDGHLSIEGSLRLGKRFNFYAKITNE